jgi:hypothetical protein
MGRPAVGDVKARWIHNLIYISMTCRISMANSGVIGSRYADAQILSFMGTGWAADLRHSRDPFRLSRHTPYRVVGVTCPIGSSVEV